MAQVAAIIDSNKERAGALIRHLAQDMGLETAWFPSISRLLDDMLSVKGMHPDVLLYMVEGDCREGINVLRRARPNVQVIALVNHLFVDKGVEAVAAGAENFLVMPFHPAQLTVAVRNALARRDLQLEIRRAFSGVRLKLDDMDFQSPAMRATLFLARSLSVSDAPVVLEGAPGSGRELLARAIHGSSAQESEAFLSFNAALLPQRMMERALFGDEQMSGVLEQVGKGAIFFRNMDVLPEKIQERLAQVLMGIKPIWQSSEKEAHFFKGRAFFAVNDAPRRHRSREKAEVNHFYSQINALPVNVPYLKDIRQDIPCLAHLYCRRFAALEGKTILGITPEALKMLSDMSWPGNLEQLSLAVFHAVMCCRGFELRKEDFRYAIEPDTSKITFLDEKRASDRAAKANAKKADGVLSCTDESGNVRRLEEVEHEIIRYALERYSGHMSDVARYLGIGRSTLYRKISSMDEK